MAVETLILHIDTSWSEGLVMLSRNGVPVAIQESTEERDHAMKLNGAIDTVLRQAGVNMGDISAIAVCNGPGSYTGLRIGLSTAKGLCFVLGCPLILNGRLTLMLEEGEKTETKLAILPARKGEYYAAMTGEKGGFSPQHIMTADLLNFLNNITELSLIVGNPGEDLEALRKRDRVLFKPYMTINTTVWGRKALDAFNSGTFADLAYSEPEYLKAAYVTKPRADR
jgi:tRNA threonylcarbamoyladenosine biosynthesis protein TsaB